MMEKARVVEDKVRWNLISLEKFERVNCVSFQEYHEKRHFESCQENDEAPKGGWDTVDELKEINLGEIEDPKPILDGVLVYVKNWFPMK